MEKPYKKFKLIPIKKIKRKRDNSAYFNYLKNKKYYQKMKQVIGKETREELQVLWTWKTLTIVFSFVLLLISIFYYKSTCFVLFMGVSLIIMGFSYFLNKKLNKLIFYYKITHDFLDILENEKGNKNHEYD